MLVPWRSVRVLVSAATGLGPDLLLDQTSGVIGACRVCSLDGVRGESLECGNTPTPVARGRADEMGRRGDILRTLATNRENEVFSHFHASN
jgi:hypothetical protein